jgi:hypothetical protein
MQEVEHIRQELIDKHAWDIVETAEVLASTCRAME